MGDLRMNDMMEERKKVIKLIRNRYILAISIIALMLILSQIIVQYNISSEEDKTSVINIGRQSSPKSCVKLSAQYLMVLHLDIISRSIFPLFRLIYQ